MYKYSKMTPYPLNIKKKDVRMAKLIITQLGGYAGELGAALRYFSQKFSMPDDMGRALLSDISTEEFLQQSYHSKKFRIISSLKLSFNFRPPVSLV